MDIEEILASDMPITNELLEINNISLTYIKDNFRELSLINRKRFLEVLNIFEQKKRSINAVDFRLKFMIMSTLVHLQEYEGAYEYALVLFEKEPKYKKDYAVYLLLLSDILGKDRNPKIANFNIFVNRFDVRYRNTTLQNSIRDSILKREYIYAKSLCSKLYAGGVEIEESEDVIKTLISEVVKKINEETKNAIADLDYATIEAFLELKKNNEKNAEDFEKMYTILCDILDGLPLNKTELPNHYDIHDVIEARDIDKIFTVIPNEVILSFAKKIKEEMQRNIENDYKGELSLYLDSVIESVYNYVENYDFESASNMIWTYLETIKKDHWIFYFLNRLDELKNKIDSLNDEKITSSLAKIFDELIAVSGSKTEKTDHYLMEKYMGEIKLNDTKLEEDNEFDYEYNYQIPNIESIIDSIHNGSISYEEYAKKEYYSEDDLFALVIMARENYRRMNYDLGDILLNIVKTLVQENEVDSNELNLFISAIEQNKSKIKKDTPFINQVKMLIQK